MHNIRAAFILVFLRMYKVINCDTVLTNVSCQLSENIGHVCMILLGHHAHMILATFCFGFVSFDLLLKVNCNTSRRVTLSV